VRGGDPPRPLRETRSRLVQGGGMLLCTFADPDGNYFQLATPWNPEST